MGFDLYGMNPEESAPKPEWTKADPWIDSDKEGVMMVDPQIKEEYDDFMKEKWEWNDENPGAYFRSNVWHWRPLWTFVCRVCDDILTEKDVEAGSYNDGHRIGKTKAKKIARKLRHLLKSRQVQAYDSIYKREQDKLDEKDWNKSYPFSVDHVKEFERFCEKSGGFEIC